jgi:hypothetical protein
MAKRTIVTTVDDIDGKTVAEETVSFGLDGVAYEIDLSKKNATKMRGDLARWVGSARRTRGRRTVRRGDTDRDQRAAIREWAHRNGYQIGARGRIPSAVIDAFHAATKVSP